MVTFTSPQLSPASAHLFSLALSTIYVGSIYISSKSRLVFNTPTPTPTPSPPTRSPTPSFSSYTEPNVANGSSPPSLNPDDIARANRRASPFNGSNSSSSSTASSGPRGKLKDERWRDDPEVIKARLTAVSIASLVCCTSVYIVLYTITPTPAPTLWDLAARLGFILPRNVLVSFTISSLTATAWDVLKLHLITPVLFFGPLYATWLAGVMPGQRYWSWEFHVRRGLWTWQGIRNVIVAPPTEEIVFRGCILSILHLAGASKYQLIFLSPLSFGLAHVHHAWDTFNRYGRTSQAAMRALLVTFFQLTYTTLFGCYTAFLFLRTSSIYPAISAHMFCNFMGFPRIGYEMQMFPRRKTSIAIAYALGVLGFYYVLFNWTWTPDSFYWANFIEERTMDLY
ncbi:Abi-domain-containing protein [Macrolepiota fuliginosa MF-IS2]|uniref:intramembrane prenyl-peptidase Rce1 n=1 Tax=Macrolepiota fuliginosa MF-IS2 TaxID=1400762 RepID=A0A9P5XAG5_9AGAR|nr:Abi-domain-containing protein [Macrolepiota fuliginosa MF-IS2]